MILGNERIVDLESKLELILLGLNSQMPNTPLGGFPTEATMVS